MRAHQFKSELWCLEGNGYTGMAGREALSTKTMESKAGN